MALCKRVLFFTLNNANKEEFYARMAEKELMFSFDVLTPEEPFTSVQDLKFFFEKNVDMLSSLYVVIDHASLNATDFPHKNNKQLKSMILAYPEVHFAFYCAGDQTYSDTLFDYTIRTPEEFVDSFHIFDPSDKYAYHKLLEQNNNLFDASNIRYCLKREKYAELHVRPNFLKQQNSRKEHLAYVIDEEKKQAFFNSYILYSNGYRVLPISSASELIRNNEEVTSGNNLLKPVMILRDYDLQFNDERGISLQDSDLPQKKSKVTLGTTHVEVNQVDNVRGFKFTEPPMSLLAKKKQRSASNKRVVTPKRWFDLLTDTNPYWSAFVDIPTYFVTKSERKGGIAVIPPCSKEFVQSTRPQILSPANNLLKVPGLSKPVTGIYSEIQKIAQVKERYQQCRYDKHDVIPSEDHSKYEYSYPIKTEREDNNHSAPLDVYEIVHSMVKRSEYYYKSGKNLHAALLSSEAMEVMNGFHLTLMLKAYYINAVSENAIAVRLLGADEDKLKKDTWFRMTVKVPEDLDRLCLNSLDLRTNLLNNIYNETRRFCKEREHFESAEIALSLTVHSSHNLWKPFARFKEKLRNRYFSKPVENEKVGPDAKLKKGIFDSFGQVFNTMFRRLPIAVQDFCRYCCNFPVSVFAFLFLFVASAVLDSQTSLYAWIVYVLLSFFLLVLVTRPMQLVYGLVGTKGDIRKFILMFVYVILSFSGVYYYGFLKDAGVTYNLDVPQIEYCLFSEDNKDVLRYDYNTIPLNKGINSELGQYVYCAHESLNHNSDSEYHYYKKINYWFGLRQTAISALTSSPSDFFIAATTNYKDSSVDCQMTRLFNLLVLFQILISWIFLGVFISLIYQKFRNE